MEKVTLTDEQKTAIREQLNGLKWGLLDVLGPDGELFGNEENGPKDGDIKVTLTIAINGVWSGHDGASREYDFDVVEVHAVEFK